MAHEPSVKLTRGHSCVLCQQRKVRCDRNKPCANCVKAGVECKVVPPQPPRRRKKRPHERELFDRLKKYESLLSQHGVDFEPLGQSFRAVDPSAIDEVDEIEHGIEGLKTSPSSQGQDGERHPKWFQYSKDYRNQHYPFQDSSEDDSEGPLIHQAFDKMFDGADGFPFVIGGSLVSITELHPPTVQIFQLWQIYLDNVNPLLKIIHTPTLQGQLIEAAANPAKIPKPLEALLFSIYYMAVLTLTDDEVQETFKEERTRMMARFHRATQQSLVNAGFMKTADIVVLQAFVMYLLAVRQANDPRAHFCLIGIAVRVANRMGLHQDAEQFQYQPFEVEMRRRLWWQLVIFDKRIAEITGSTITALSSSRGNCKWPLNINDSDLHVNAKDRITPYTGPTEMLFSLTRFELTVAADPEGARPVANLAGTTPSGKPKFQYSPSPVSSDVFTNAARHNLPMADLDGYIKYLEERYLNHCDNKIPVHFFTFLMTRQAICKLRLIDYYSHGYLQRFPDPNTMPAADRAIRDAIFTEAIQVIEYDNVIQSSDALRGFKWYTAMHFPFPPFAFLATELRYVTTGDLCERAWAAIIENHEQRKIMNNVKSPMYTAIGGTLLRAWDGHEAAQAQLGRVLPQPKMITILRDVVRKLKAESKEGTSSQRDAGHKPNVGTANSSASSEKYAGSHQAQHHQTSDMDVQSTGSSPPMITGPGGAMDPMAGALFGPGFSGMGQPMYGPSMMSDMNFGMMDWNNGNSWSSGYLAPGGYDASQPNMPGYASHVPH
ncbi:fungal-specific transcription factor domain-domain-containing protein [Coniella lustricola]|uniref:Fungal-specific transcription factor domain-domain-containing protein n=1 Tax=Coniella lustricola TaxID=2025994 RepID=A0A2T3AK88_9PEZI|nr:fungal-specific transcription factor domain-domain-containing protein [Coniella lustricola]